jgi:hypothetical protein
MSTNLTANRARFSVRFRNVCRLIVSLRQPAASPGAGHRPQVRRNVFQCGQRALSDAVPGLRSGRQPVDFARPARGDRRSGGEPLRLRWLESAILDRSIWRSVGSGYSWTRPDWGYYLRELCLRYPLPPCRRQRRCRHYPRLVRVVPPFRKGFHHRSLETILRFQTRPCRQCRNHRDQPDSHKSAQ